MPLGAVTEEHERPAGVLGGQAAAVVVAVARPGVVDQPERGLRPHKLLKSKPKVPHMNPTGLNLEPIFCPLSGR